MRDQASIRTPSEIEASLAAASTTYGILADLSAVTGRDDAEAIVRAFREVEPPRSRSTAVGAALALLRGALLDAGEDGLLLQSDQVTSTILLPDFPPYSTRYGDGAMFREQDDLADIAGFYKAFGVGVDPGRKERPDHLSVELEFLALLCFKERIALAEEDPEKTEVTVEAERRFLRDYVGPFLFSVVEGLRARSAPPIFLAWASVLHELLLVEHARLFLPVPETVRARIPATGMEYGPMACLGDIA